MPVDLCHESGQNSQEKLHLGVSESDFLVDALLAFESWVGFGVQGGEGIKAGDEDADWIGVSSECAHRVIKVNMH